MDSEKANKRHYRSSELPRLLGHAVHVLRAFGFAGEHVVLIGGLAPSILVPKPDIDMEPHVGTRDLDFCLSISLIENEVGEYERLETALRGAGFEMAREKGKPVSWRWRDSESGHVTLEFFCAAGPGREAGKLHRPGGVIGGKLSTIPLEAGELVERDRVQVTVAVELPDNKGETQHHIHVAGPASYIALKVDALRKRNKDKDAYDLVWLFEAWPGGQRALAETIRSSAIYGDPLMASALIALEEEFANTSRAGAIKFANFMREDDASFEALARRAVGAVRALLAALRG